MSLGLTPERARYISSPRFNDAVNDAQFVRTFGLIACVGSLLVMVSGAVAIGLGLAVIGFGQGRFFKVLGITVAALGVASIFVKLLGIVASLALASGVVWKSVEILRLLNHEGKDDPDWGMTHRRAIFGLVSSRLGSLISLCWGAAVVLGLVLTALSDRG